MWVAMPTVRLLRFVAGHIPWGSGRMRTHERERRADTVRPIDPARVLVMVEQPLIAAVLKLTLNHGVYVTREVRVGAESTNKPDA